MYTITYNLREDEERTVEFYSKLKQYSDQLYSELDEQLYDVAMHYFRYRRHEGLEQVYSLKECYLELLSLGVYWVVYSGDAEATEASTNEFMQSLSHLREINKQLKPLVDAFRGICLTAMMSPDLYDHMGIAEPSVESLEQLLSWLEATGEFDHESKRFSHWLAYLKTLSTEKSREILTEIISLGFFFETDSKGHLGAYTKGVDRYLNELRPKHYWKEDVIFCGRRRVEYHLNFIGGIWLNEAYQEAFKKASKKVVLTPSCMRIYQDDLCAAEKEGEWLVCSGCHPQCQVNQIKSLQSTYDFTHYMILHNSALRNAPPELLDEETAVLGIACALNLISGGFMLAAQKIPAQCVPLDYCGCKTHWHLEGMPTSIDLEQFKTLLRR